MHKNNFRNTLKKILNTREPYRLQGSGRRESAVLIPLYENSGEYYLIFTKRSSRVKYHQGHVSFPGGVVDKKDRSPEETAGREAFEEIGVLKEHVEILGPIDDSLTFVPPFAIHPFVGLVPYPYSFKLNPNEVEKIIEVPLKFFLPYADPSNDWAGINYKKDIEFPTFHYRGETIWGTTAAITANFIGILSSNNVIYESI